MKFLSRTKDYNDRERGLSGILMECLCFSAPSKYFLRAKFVMNERGWTPLYSSGMDKEHETHWIIEYNAGKMESFIALQQQASHFAEISENLLEEMKENNFYPEFFEDGSKF